jgi:hypothetical protein
MHEITIVSFGFWVCAYWRGQPLERKPNVSFVIGVGLRGYIRQQLGIQKHNPTVHAQKFFKLVPVDVCVM